MKEPKAKNMKKQTFKIIMPDVRPLSQRMGHTAAELRKGMKQPDTGVLILPEGSTGKQLDLWKRTKQKTA